MSDGLIYNNKEIKNLSPDTPLHGAFRRTVQRTGNRSIAPAPIGANS